MLEFRLLGPLEVRDGERTLPVRRQKQRALLAVLLLNAGRPVSKDRLIDQLWGEQAPRMAKGALENYVSQVRKVLGKEILATEPAGYLLRVEPEQIDVRRFERLVADARAAEAEERAAKLTEALALFRGPPLADLAYEPFAEIEILRLGELELAAREDLLEAELELGRHVDVISELEALIARNPYRERLRAQLMLALYRSGRQADALGAYQVARRTLVDQLGIEPSESLQQLEQAILRQDESLRAPSRADVPKPERREPAPRPARKTVTILHFRLAGASVLAEQVDPELLQTILARFASDARRAVDRHGGVLETMPGESVTAVFGVPAAREDDALRALRAAMELREALASSADDETPAHRLQAQTGIATGQVFVGGSPGGRIATGATVDLADRLAKAAGPGEVLADAETRELAGDAATAEQREAGTFLVVALTGDTLGRRLRLDSPLVGRKRPLRALRRSFDDVVQDRACHLFTVLGGAGVGKSRLLRELVDSLEGATVLDGHCLPYGEGVAFWPLFEAVRDLAASADVLDLIAREDAQEGVFASARMLFEGLAREAPLLIVFDDLQWADPRFLDLVEHVAERSRGAPIMIVCLARPELLDARPTWGGGKTNATSMLLEPLTDGECERLLDNLLGASDLPEPVRAHIVRSSGGNPLFLEELLENLVDRNVLRMQQGRWTTTELPVLAVPPSLRALIASRIDLLPEDERIALELASVEGVRFHTDAVAELAPEELQSEVEEWLAGLVRRELVHPPQGSDQSYSFRHQLVRDAAYDSIPKQTRAELHERLADWLERTSPARYGESAAYHRELVIRYRTELRIEGV